MSALKLRGVSPMSLSVKALTLAAVLGLFAMAPARAQAPELAQPDPSVQRAVAIVNEDVISQYDVERRLSLVLASTGGKRTPQEIAQLRQQVLKGLVDEKLQLQEAREHDVAITGDTLEDYFKRVAQNFNQTPDQFESFLKDNGTSKEALQDQIKAEMAWSRLVQRQLEPQVNIGDDEVEEVMHRMEESKGQFEYNLSEIFLTFSPDNEDQVKLTAERIVERVRGGAPFAAYARQFSDAATAAVGGNMGWVIESQLSPDILLAVRDMRVNQIADPIRGPGGYQVIMLNDRRRILSADPLDLQLDLRQIFWALPSDTAQADIDAKIKDIKGKLPETYQCPALNDVATQLGASNSNNIGTLRLRDLPPDMRDNLQPLEAGQGTDPMAFPSGIRVLVVCDRIEPQVKPPTFDAIYGQLNQQRLSMMARRYLRDLRRDAIVDYR